MVESKWNKNKNKQKKQRKRDKERQRLLVAEYSNDETVRFNRAN